MRSQPEIGRGEVSSDRCHFFADKGVEALTVTDAEAVEDGGAKDGDLGAEVDGSFRIALAMRTHQEHDASNLRQLPQNPLEQDFAEVARGAGDEQGLACEKLSHFTHDSHLCKERQRCSSESSCA